METSNPGREGDEVTEQVDAVYKSLRWREKENRILVAEGFEAVEGGSLWLKDGLLFGRGAALQSVREKLSEDEGTTAAPSFSF